eukprot:4905471-Prymnesium_polylepis.1
MRLAAMEAERERFEAEKKRKAVEALARAQVCPAALDTPLSSDTRTKYTRITLLPLRRTFCICRLSMQRVPAQRGRGGEG